MEFNKTWPEARYQCPLPSLCFSGRSEKQDGRPVFWLAETFSTSPLKPLNGIQRNLTGSNISTSSTKFVFFGPIGKTRWPPWPLNGRDIFDFPAETGSKISTSSTKFVLFGPIGKTRWPPLPLIGWDIFDFSSETVEWNSTKFYKKQDLNILYQVCIFSAYQKNEMAAMASDWLRHFWLLFWNRWMEFNETWQEARSQHPLPSLWGGFFGRWVNKNCRPGRSVKKVAHCTQVHDMWPFGPLVYFWVIWAYCSCLACFCVASVNLHFNFLMVRDSDCIFGIHTTPMGPSCWWPLDLDCDFYVKNSFFRLCCCWWKIVSQTYLLRWLLLITQLLRLVGMLGPREPA